MGVNRVWTHRLFAPIPVSSTGQALTFPRKRGKGLKVIQRSLKTGAYTPLDARLHGHDEKRH